MEELVQQLLNKSQALWQINYHGFIAPNIHQQFVVGISSPNARIQNAFRKLIGSADNILFVGTRASNKITCFRMEAAVPIFAVAGVSQYETRYKIERQKQSRISYHSDTRWLRKMEEANYSIWPTKVADNSLPLWVLGLAYRFIRLNEGNNKYEIYSVEQGEALRGYWVELSEYRDSAFTAFRQGKYQNELENLIQQKQLDEGDVNTKNFIAGLKKDDEYKLHHMQLNVDFSLLFTPPYRPVAELVERELSFVTRELRA